MSLPKGLFISAASVATRISEVCTLVCAHAPEKHIGEEQTAAGLEPYSISRRSTSKLLPKVDMFVMDSYQKFRVKRRILLDMPGGSMK